MTGSMAPTGTASSTQRVPVPDGFFAEIATALHTETAEEIADTVIAVCIRRGILHPELEEDPEDELRAEEVREVFGLLAAVTDAVADGTIIPSGVHVTDEMDPDMAAAWEAFVDDAADPQAAAAAAAMLNGELPDGHAGVK